MIAVHPEDHSLIKGTVDHVPATALVNPKDFPQRDGGSIEVPFAGDTETHWDGQWTETLGQERVFMSRRGNRCKESEILLLPEEYLVQAFNDGNHFASCKVPSVFETEDLNVDSHFYVGEILDWALENGDWRQPGSEESVSDWPEGPHDFEVVYESAEGHTMIYDETR
jgi:hypothetical protein